MRRVALLSVLLLVAFLALPTTTVAQQTPSRQGGQPLQPMRPCAPDCEPPPDNPPIVELWEPLAPTGEQYPHIEIQFCDDQGLDYGTRYIAVNGVDRTANFDYVSPGFAECGSPGGEERHSNTTSVPLNIGSNTLYAFICDYNDHCTGQTWTITRSSQGPPVVALRNYNADNRDRGLCLTLGAGQAAGLSCGDLFVTHGMPAYRTMGRDRSLALFYSSETAVPRPAVAVAVTQPQGTATPQSVYAELRIDGSPAASASATYYAFGPGSTQQIVLAFDASGLATGIHSFVVEVRNQYPGAYASSVGGELLVVNRGASEFGTGWWLAGVERLVAGQSGNRILWVGGDGSAAVYNAISASTWVRATGAFRDTIVLASGIYTRSLRHGVRVTFDASGRHYQTITRAGHVTQFTWGTPPGYSGITRLLSIAVPSGSAPAKLYQLTYEGTNALIDVIADPAGRWVNPYLGTPTSTGYTISHVDDADNGRTSFSYDAAGRMNGRTTRRGFGYRTEYSYGNGLHVTRVAIPLNPAIADSSQDSARTRVEWWDERGLAIGVTGGMRSSVDTAQAYTRVFGPRPNVADDATFWVDRWGAPTRIIGAVADTTSIARSATTGLVARLRDPVGRIVGMTYDGRGNLLTASDSTHEGHGTGGGFQIATTRYTYRDLNAPDAPDSVIDPMGTVARYQYTSLGQPSLAIAPDGQQTQFTYETGALVGLLSTVTELQVPTYTDTVTWPSYNPPTSPLNPQTRFFYNPLGNLDSTRSPMGHLSAYRYNAYTQVDSVIDALGNVTQYFPRPMGVVDSVVQLGSGGQRRRYWSEYDLNFNRIRFRDPRNVTREWSYDRADRQTSEIGDLSPTQTATELRYFGPSGLLDSTRTRTNLVMQRTTPRGV